MSSTVRLSEELSAGPARLRVDVYGAEPIAHVLDDMSFLDFVRAASPQVLLDEVDKVLQAGP